MRTRSGPPGVLQPQVSDFRQVVFEEDSQGPEPGDVDQAVALDPDRFPIEKEEDGEQEQDQDAHRPAEHPEPLEQHRYQVAYRVDVVAQQGDDHLHGDPAKDREQDGEHDAGRPRPAGRKRNGGRAGRIIEQGEADPFGAGELARGRAHLITGSIGTMLVGRVRRM